MHTTNNTPGENYDKKDAGKTNTDPVEERTETPLANDKEPVGPFEHSGEVAGWTAAEEETEEERKQEEGGDRAAS